MTVSKTEPRGVSLTWSILHCLDAERHKQPPFPWALADLHQALGGLTDKQAEDVIAALTSALSILDGEAPVGGGSDVARFEGRDERSPDILVDPFEWALEQAGCVNAAI